MKGVSDDFTGDGTGYTLTITRHYRTKTAKHSHDFLYVFRVIDVDTAFTWPANTLKPPLLG
jgi:transposase